MTLIVDVPGTRIGKKGRSIGIYRPNESVSVRSLVKIDELIFTTKGSLSTDAIILLANNGIPTLVVKGSEPVALIHGFFNHGTVITRRNQILAYNDERGTHLAKMFVIGALINRARLMNYWGRNRSQSSPEISKELIIISNTIKEIIPHVSELEGHIDDIRQELMGYEAEGAAHYFAGLKKIIPENFDFNARTMHPPRDAVSSMLSYAYQILYTRILKAIAIVGLEPYAGFLHTDRSGKPSLIYDLSEEFKQSVIDRIIIRLVSRGQVKPEGFKWEGTRLRMDDKTKTTLLDALAQAFNSSVKYKGSERTIWQILIKQARSIVRYLIGKNKTYEPFTFME